MSLLKASVLNALAVVVRVGAGLVLNKVWAIFIGPTGYALIGQFQNLVNMGTTFASAGVSSGVTKYTAEFASDSAARYTYWRAAFTLSTGCVLMMSAVIVIWRKPLANYLLKDAGYADVMVWLSVLLIFMVWNALLLAILNGLKELHRFVAVNISGSLIGLGAGTGLVYFYGMKGALISVVLSQAIVFVATVCICCRTSWFRRGNFWGKAEGFAVRRLSGFALMALVSAVVVPGAQILIRDHLGEKFGWTAAGYWQAMTKVSDVYLLVITLTLSYYYLPRLSEIKSGSKLKREVFNAYKYLLPLACALALPIYLLRDWVTVMLFSREFMPMRELFFWQLIGDVMKIGSWLLAFLMVAKAMTKQYIITEITFSVSLVGLTILFSSRMGIEGAVFAFAVNYFVYWMVMYFVCRDVFQQDAQLA